VFSSTIEGMMAVSSIDIPLFNGNISLFTEIPSTEHDDKMNDIVSILITAQGLLPCNIQVE